MFTGCIESDLRDINIFLDGNFLYFICSWCLANFGSAILRTHPTIDTGTLSSSLITELSSSNIPAPYNRLPLRSSLDKGDIFRMLLHPTASMLGQGHFSVLQSLMERIGEYIVQQTGHWRMLVSVTSESTEYDRTPPGVPSINEFLTCLDTSEGCWSLVHMLAWFAVFRHRKAISDFFGINKLAFYHCISLLTISNQEVAHRLINSLNRSRKSAHGDRNASVCIQVIILLSASIHTHETFATTGGKTLQPAELADIEKIIHLQKFCSYHAIRCIDRASDATIETARFIRSWCTEIGEMDLTHWPCGGLLSKMLSEMTPYRLLEQMRLFLEEVLECWSPNGPTELGLEQFMLFSAELLKELAPTELGRDIEVLNEGYPEQEHAKG